VRILVVVVAALGVLLSEARAERIEVFVPYECQSLAQEYGVPYVLHSRTQITYAIYKLNRLGGSQAGVSECRAAVARMKAAYQARKDGH
jgi:hypothetical protein